MIKIKIKNRMKNKIKTHSFQMLKIIFHAVKSKKKKNENDAFIQNNFFLEWNYSS